METMLFSERVIVVRKWLAANLIHETLEFPNEDDTWEFITTTWRMIPTDLAERVLGEAMRPIQFAA